jgi:hypothetical protein
MHDLAVLSVFMFLLRNNRFYLNLVCGCYDKTCLANLIFIYIVATESLYYTKGSWSSSVSIATRLRPGRQGFHSRQGQGIFYSSPRPDRRWVPPSLISNRYRRIFPRIKWPGRESDHLLPSCTAAKNAWSYNSTPPYVFME